MIDTAKLTVIPPGPVTDKIVLDIRVAIEDNSSQIKSCDVKFFLDEIVDSNLMHSEKITLEPNRINAVCFRLPTAGMAGEHCLIMQSVCGNEILVEKQQVDIYKSQIRSLQKIHGSWCSITHWSDIEAKYFNEGLRAMTDTDWRDMVSDMHKLGMNTIVIQEVFRNQMNVGQHSIEKDGYHGKAYYPSKLYPGRMEMNASDPVEAILSQADELRMQVFPGVGLYAWFDFTPASLQWHKDVVQELWQMYGHHKSFYGWYVSEEAYGDLGTDNVRRQEIVDFFREFSAFCRELTPSMPIMLAPNCHNINAAVDYWPRLLENLDILCPFGFHRMPQDDMTGSQAADLLQEFCDAANTHLWMDMEIFLFEEDTALYPRPIEGVIKDMEVFPNFEKILCYQYPGLMNSPTARIKPGGERTLKLFNDYKKTVS